MTMNFPSCGKQNNAPSSKDIHVPVPELVNTLGFKANKVTVC